MYCREKNQTEILKKLWTFTAVQQRMILQESLATRRAGKVSRLFSLAKDSVLLSLATNNSQERLAGPLVARLGEKLKWKDWETGQELLRKMASFSGESNYSYHSFVFIINISGFQGDNDGE